MLLSLNHLIATSLSFFTNPLIHLSPFSLRRSYYHQQSLRVLLHLQRTINHLYIYIYIAGQQGKGGGHLLFNSTTSALSRTLRHLFATLHVR